MLCAVFFLLLSLFFAAEERAGERRLLNPFCEIFVAEEGGRMCVRAGRGCTVQEAVSKL